MDKSRVELAKELHKKGYSCSQSVLCAYCDLVGLDKTTAIKVSEGFGLGMATMEVCGALTGAYMVAGLKCSAGEGDFGKNTKANTASIIREMASMFKEKNQSIICRDLKGVETKKVLRSCDGCIEDAAEILEKVLFSD